MSRGGSFGGGQSSLGYLFSSEEQPTAPPPSRTVTTPPYGVDTTTETPPDNDESSKKQNASNNYPRAQGQQNTGNFITCIILLFLFFSNQDRPSTKVKSVPGGDSSLGYLFGDK
ncbi:hypothetical protein JRO89_XS13G0158300 [Xanthoceras sorbifolium]|uniref:Protein SPIRAL1-like 5 n=1 Tax=Xanthoceras sorbifolium TaxID=99658 RepID=A0ABQ8H8K9_9ROSI|nr:hypothetical protein JRO89_XS13G0158300 [Xanthoceras sorbifolium]